MAQQDKKKIDLKKISSEVEEALKALEKAGELNRVEIVLNIRRVEEGKQVDQRIAICSPTVTDD